MISSMTDFITAPYSRWNHCAHLTLKNKQTYELDDELDSIDGIVKSRQAKNRSQNPRHNQNIVLLLPGPASSVTDDVTKKNPISTGATKRTITKCSFPLMNNE